ncbi:Kelch repeat-containing protein [Enterococcus faecium]|uniref:Kelch repeat-containing protein n=1 Tax=Enterococcus faecium TaxID=1352 RepID=UPI003D316BA1
MKKWFVVFFLFVITLFQSLQTVSAETVEWKERADLPEPRVGASSGVVDGKIYVIGGGTVKPGAYGNQTFVYDPKTNEWTRKADMPTARGGAASVTVDGKIYVLGGMSNDGAVNTIEVYDPKKDTWEKLDDLPFERKVPAYKIYAEAIGKKIYVVAFENSRYATTYSYDLETKKWQKKQNLNYEVTGAVTGASTAVIDNKLYILGGTHYIPQIVYVYDPEKDTWVENGKGFTAGYYSALTYKGKILMTGGVNRIKVYDPKSQSATAVKNPKAPYRMAHSSAVIDDTLYVIGGREETSSFTGSAASKFKSVMSISLKDLNIPSDSEETPGDKDKGSTTPSEDNSAEDGDALLVVTMVNGLQKEYQLSMKEVNGFLKWYKQRDAGEGPGFYEIDEHDNNKGPFESKKDYVVFKNILMYEVNKYK